MPKHVWTKSGDGHFCNDMGECMLCSLSHCKVCGGFEGSLTTDCPGVIMTHEQGEEVYNGKLNYVDSKGGWVHELGPCQRSALRRGIFDLLRGRGDAKSEAQLRLDFRVTKKEFNEIKAECLKYLTEDADKPMVSFNINTSTVAFVLRDLLELSNLTTLGVRNNIVRLVDTIDQNYYDAVFDGKELKVFLKWTVDGDYENIAKTVTNKNLLTKMGFV